MYNFMTGLVVLSIVVETILTDADLHQQNLNQDHLNPTNDYDYDAVAKDQDKRTVFSPTVSNYGWAKHVGVNPIGMKYVIGYGPVDLKYVPVIKPVSIRHHHGYHYPKPKPPRYHHHHHHHHHIRPAVPVRPSLTLKPIHTVGWKPVLPVVKPIVPVNIPPPPPLLPPQLVDKPWHQFEKPVAVVKPIVPVQPAVHPVQPVPVVKPVHVKPVIPVHLKPVVAPVHHVPIAPVHHVPIAPVHHVPIAPVLKPFVPQPFIPSPLFEVTKPNLGVLSLGASFPSPVLQQIPTAPAALPLPHFKPAVLASQPQPLYPSGTVVEYHGTHNFVPFNNQVPVPLPFLPQTPVNAVQPLYPHIHHLHPQHVPVQPQVPHQHLPQTPHEQHDVQTPFLPANHPNFFQQQLPVNAQPHFFNQIEQTGGHHNFFQQQLPVDAQPHFVDQARGQHNVLQQQLPEDSQSHQFFDQVDQSNGLHRPEQDIPNIQHFNRHIIQPGQTDLQLPLHLPQHNFVPDGRQFQPGNFHDPSRYPDNVFKPSISLEPPYVSKRRADDKK